MERDSKLKKWARHAVARAAALKNQHQSRFSHARSDVVQLLNLGHHEQALRRIKHVIQERSLVEVLRMVEKYCQFLAEKATQSSNKDPSRELKVAISSLVFVSSRIGEFPELQRIRDTIASKYGNEYAVDLIESYQSNVNLQGVLLSQIIQKFSPRQLSSENRLMVLKEIAAENRISLQLGEDFTVIEKLQARANQRKRSAHHQESAHVHST